MFHESTVARLPRLPLGMGVYAGNEGASGVACFVAVSIWPL